MKNEKLIGIITAIDILKAYVKLCNDLEKVDFTAFGDFFRQLESLGKLK